MIFDTSKIFTNSKHPLALLYKSLLSFGKDLSLTIIPSMLNEAALLIIDPMFLGSVTSSSITKVMFFLSKFSLINSLRIIFSRCSTSATNPWCVI